MGGSEIIVILIVALLFLGPDKLPSAAKSISKGIRDIKKQSRSLQQQIESDDQIGGAIRDLKSALRGEEEPIRPRPIKPRKQKELATGADPRILPPIDVAALATAAATEPLATPELPPIPPLPELPSVTLPAMVGEPGDVEPDAEGATDDNDDLASLIKPASGTVAKGSDPEHG